MRSAVVSLLLWLCLVASAQAERRMFIIANDADGYGIDRCLAFGETCGTAAANAYCKTQAFAQATTFHKVDRDDITGVIPANGVDGCNGSSCAIVAITCAR